MGAPSCGRRGPGLGYDKHELLHGVFHGLCTLSCSFDGCSDAVAEVQVAVLLGCNVVDMGNCVFYAYSLQHKQMFVYMMHSYPCVTLCRTPRRQWFKQLRPTSQSVTKRLLSSCSGGPQLDINSTLSKATMTVPNILTIMESSGQHQSAD